MMPQLKKKSFKFFELRYEMSERKQTWKSLLETMEKQTARPLEERVSIVSELVNLSGYNALCAMLDIPLKETLIETPKSSVETMIPFIPPTHDSSLTQTRKSIYREKSITTMSSASTSGSSLSFQSDDESSLISQLQQIEPELVSGKTETVPSSDLTYKAISDYVEVEKVVSFKHEQLIKHKALLKFLELPEEEAASWRKKERNVKELSEMTLEEKGEFLINKTAEDFCEWVRSIGGNEETFISEEILKDLFQIGIDNPATKGICLKMLEKKILHNQLAEFLDVADKSFIAVLSQHLHWDAKAEKKPQRSLAFGKHLPKDLVFKVPKNKTAETWLEYNKLTPNQLNFADVYSPIQGLKSTHEYCKWLLLHPEHKKPRYLVDIGMFERISEDSQIERHTVRISEDSEIIKPEITITIPHQTLKSSKVEHSF